MRKLYEPDEVSKSVGFAAGGQAAAGLIDGAFSLDTPSAGSTPSLRFDWADWLPYLEDQDASEEQKRELIESLWSIVVAFVDFGWRVESNPETGNAFDLRAILTRSDIEKEVE